MLLRLGRSCGPAGRSDPNERLTAYYHDFGVLFTGAI